MKANEPRKKLSPQELEAMIPKWQKRDEKLIRGVFTNHEKPGQSHKFYLRTYKDEPIEELILHDGERKTLTVAWVNHINSCCYTEYLDAKDAVPNIAGVKRMMNDDGTESTKMSRKVKRFSFAPLDYSDDLIEEESNLWQVDKEATDTKIIV